MTTESCREWRGALASAALGRLEDAEAIALQAHLDGCAACRAELAALTSVARALPRADIERVADVPGEPPSRLEEQVVGRIAAIRADRGRRRWRALVAVAAVVAAGAGIGAVIARTNDGDRPAPAATIDFPFGGEASGHAELDARAEGTQVRLVASGLDDGDWYWLWLTGDDGGRVTAGTFRGTGGDVEVTMTAAIPLEDARRIWVTDGDDAVVLDATVSRDAT
jgi:hypothetical protein